MKEPKRLLEGDELPASVRDGLRLLGQATARPDDVARVQSALEQLTKAAPSGGGLASGGAGLSSTTLIVSAAAIVVTAAIVAVRYVSPVPTSVPTSVPAASTATPPHEASKDAPLLPVAVAVEASPSAMHEATEVPVEPVRAEPPPAHGDERALTPSSARKQRIRAPELHGRTVSATSERSAAAPAPVNSMTALAVSADTHAHEPSAEPAVAADAESRVDESDATPSNAEPALPRAPAKSPAASERVEVPSASVGSEAELLYRAKRLGTQDAAAALQLLAGLAARFPDGAFTEEREVLAIKLHERLGHTEQVKALSAAFRARFPHSMYRNAILP